MALIVNVEPHSLGVVVISSVLESKGSMWRFAIESLRGGIGVRLRLSLLAMAAIVPLFALLVGGLVTDRHIAIQTARTHAMDLARLIAERQADSVQQAKELLSVLRRTPEIIENAESCHAMLKMIAADQSQFNTIGIARPDGLLLCNSAITDLKKFSDTDFLRRVMASDPSSFSLSRFRIGAITGKPTIFVGTPLRADDDGISPGMIFVSLKSRAVCLRRPAIRRFRRLERDPRRGAR